MIKTATEIVKIIQNQGNIAYFAGGYVRDKLLGVDSNDIDIVTSATPDEIEKLFPQTSAVGKKFGIIVVNKNNYSFEVATFRSESDYLDKRRPKNISFTDAKADATRRDFTVNALFYDPLAKKIIDFVGGEEDIKKRVIRFIGDPVERINEDYLRLIRAIRFKSTLNFQYDKFTFAAVRANAHLIQKVSKERIRDELNKIVQCSNRHIALIELSQSGLLGFIIPEIENLKGIPQPAQHHREGDVFTHTYLAFKSLPADSDLRLCWAVLLHDIAKPQTLIREGKKIIFHNHAQVSAEVTRDILARLKFSKTDIKAITFLVENHMRVGHIDKMRPGKKLHFLTNPLSEDLVKLIEADQKGKIPTDLTFVKKFKDEIVAAQQLRKKIQKNNQDKIIDGHILLEMGFVEGPKIKEILDDVNDEIVKGKISTRNKAKIYIRDKYEN